MARSYRAVRRVSRRRRRRRHPLQGQTVLRIPEQHGAHQEHPGDYRPSACTDRRAGPARHRAETGKNHSRDPSLDSNSLIKNGLMVDACGIFGFGFWMLAGFGFWIFENYGCFAGPIGGRRGGWEAADEQIIKHL